jgi:hypothetical protein
MTDDHRVSQVRQLLVEYLRSPSLKHIRDPHSISKLALELVGRMDHGSSIWMKWNGQRELLTKLAVGCWIPVEDLLEVLNRLPGPRLTLTDVAQRQAAFEEEDYHSYPNQELQDGCLAIYTAEQTAGTELASIIGRIRAHVEQEEQRLRIERQNHFRQHRESERLKRVQRLLSGADCGWTQLPKSPQFYCRANGRAYRLSPSKDKKWQLDRVGDLDDHSTGQRIGTYLGRGDATKAIATHAYRPEF